MKSLSYSVLHVFDCASVSCTLAKFQRQQGHDARVISFAKMDPFGFLTFYGEERLNTVDPTEFYLTAIDRAVDYDIVHVHFVWGIIPYLRNKYGSSKKIILHYHGSDIRQFQNDRNRLKAESMADAVIGSTPDLVQYSQNIQHIPNPIDTDHFKRQPKDFDRPRYFTILSDEPELVKRHISRLGIDCHYLTRKTMKLDYAIMPALYHQYTDYVDIKYQDGQCLTSRSKTAFEALACGLRVTTPNDTKITEMPESHKPEHVTKQVENIYKTAPKQFSL